MFPHFKGLLMRQYPMRDMIAWFIGLFYSAPGFFTVERFLGRKLALVSH